MEKEDNVSPDPNRVDPSEDEGSLGRDPGQQKEDETDEEEGAEQ
jgi:hypothetical protein